MENPIKDGRSATIPFQSPLLPFSPSPLLPFSLAPFPPLPYPSGLVVGNENHLAFNSTGSEGPFSWWRFDSTNKLSVDPAKVQLYPVIRCNLGV